jgi:hypothetical protein
MKLRRWRRSDCYRLIAEADGRLARQRVVVQYMQMTKTPSHPSGMKMSSKSAAGKILGVTKDGVRILDQGRATHFTAKELRSAVKSVQAAKRAG